MLIPLNLELEEVNAIIDELADSPHTDYADLIAKLEQAIITATNPY
jgi:hypothetical protein